MLAFIPCTLSGTFQMVGIKLSAFVDLTIEESGFPQSAQTPSFVAPFPHSDTSTPRVL